MRFLQLKHRGLHNIFYKKHVNILCIPRSVLCCASVTLWEIPGRIFAFKGCALLGVRQPDAGVRREATCFTTFYANTFCGLAVCYLGGRFCKVAIKTLLPELAIYAAAMYMQWAQTTVRSVTFCKNVRQETHKSTWKCMSAFPANTPLGLLEPLKDSRQTQNAKIRSMEFPRRSSQHGEAPARKHRTSTDFYIKNIMRYS